MKQNVDRFIKMARCYHEMAPVTVPHYHWLQHAAIETICHANPNQQHLVDLGGGSGRLVKHYLDRFPSATATIVDTSPAFLELAREHLGSLKCRVQFLLHPLEKNWSELLSCQSSAICSMSCIHHLTNTEKEGVYRQAYEALAQGGVFINVDEMKAEDEPSYQSDLAYWWKYVNEARTSVPQEALPLFEEFFGYFEKWKIRNIDHYHKPKQKGEDLHESMSSQLEMLQKVGFTSVHSPFHFRLWHGISGQK